MNQEERKQQLAQSAEKQSAAITGIGCLGFAVLAITALGWVAIHFHWVQGLYHCLYSVCTFASWWPLLTLIGITAFEVLSTMFYRRVVFKWGQAWVKAAEPLRKRSGLHCALFSADISVLGCFVLIAFGSTGTIWEIIHRFAIPPMAWTQAQPYVITGGVTMAIIFWIIWYAFPAWFNTIKFFIKAFENDKEPQTIPSYLAHALLKMPPKGKKGY